VGSVIVHPEVAQALRDGAAVVALESAVTTAGLPRSTWRDAWSHDRIDQALPEFDRSLPVNLACARMMTDAVRAAGAIPATIALLDGAVRIGIDDDQLERLASDTTAGKASTATMAAVLAEGGSAGTTVSGTLVGCRLAGGKTGLDRPIRHFATGGIGGVHRGWTTRPDISADLLELSRTPACVVSAGAKSILDLPATVEALESRSVPVVGHGTDRFPAFVARTGADAPAVPEMSDPGRIASMCRHHWETLDAPGAVLVVQALPAGEALDAAEVDRLTEQAEDAAEVAGATGAARTPFLLDAIATASHGRALQANLVLLRNNAVLAATIATVANR
jgi:pseudouridine-5'-phosphate glycosidase